MEGLRRVEKKTKEQNKVISAKSEQRLMETKYILLIKEKNTYYVQGTVLSVVT